MTDVILIAAIVAFFAAAALVVRVLDRMIVGSGDAAPSDGPDDEPGADA
jgi:hypothetical protein